MFMKVLHTLTPELQAMIALSAILLLGLPHGAFDYARYRFYHPEAGRGQRIRWLLSYLLSVVAIIGLWVLFSGIIFLLLLGFAAWHFGREDGLESGKRWHRVLDNSARGLLVIALPVAVYPEQMALLYGLFVTEGTRAELLPLFLQGRWILAGFLGLLIGGAIWVNVRMQSGRTLELITIAALFVLLPPLIAFTVYFCVWHSARHYAEQRKWLRQASSSFRAYTLGSVILCSMVMIAGILLTVVFWQEGAHSLRAVVVTFIALLAITVPHHLSGYMTR